MRQLTTTYDTCAKTLEKAANLIFIRTTNCAFRKPRTQSKNDNAVIFCRLAVLFVWIAWRIWFSCVDMELVRCVAIAWRSVPFAGSRWKKGFCCIRTKKNFTWSVITNSYVAMVIKTPRERYFHSFMLHFDNSGEFSRQSIIKSRVSSFRTLVK